MNLLIQSILLAVVALILIVVAFLTFKPIIAFFAFVTWLLAIFSAWMHFKIQADDDSTYRDDEEGEQ